MNTPFNEAWCQKLLSFSAEDREVTYGAVFQASLLNDAPEEYTFMLAELRRIWNFSADKVTSIQNSVLERMGKVTALLAEAEAYENSKLRPN